MGGSGSGRHYHWGKDTTSDYRVIDVGRWQRDGFLEPHQSFGWQWSRDAEVVASIQVRTESDQVILTYRYRSGGGDWEAKKYPVLLGRTPCNFGGTRTWFLCPASGCGRRVALLYSGGIFACRHCYQLAYDCQRESEYERILRKKRKVGDRISDDRYNVWRKKKGLHQKTFDKHFAEWLKLDETSELMLLRLVGQYW